MVDIVTGLKESQFDHATVYGNGDGAGKRALVEELSETMKLTAICGLGTVASNPLASLLDHFEDDVKQYLK